MGARRSGDAAGGARCSSRGGTGRVVVCGVACGVHPGWCSFVRAGPDAGDGRGVVRPLGHPDRGPEPAHACRHCEPGAGPGWAVADVGLAGAASCRGRDQRGLRQPVRRPPCASAARGVGAPRPRTTSYAGLRAGRAARPAVGRGLDTVSAGRRRDGRGSSGLQGHSRAWTQPGGDHAAAAADHATGAAAEDGAASDRPHVVVAAAGLRPAAPLSGADHSRCAAPPTIAVTAGPGERDGSRERSIRRCAACVAWCRGVRRFASRRSRVERPADPARGRDAVGCDGAAVDVDAVEPAGRGRPRHPRGPVRVRRSTACVARPGRGRGTRGLRGPGLARDLHRALRVPATGRVVGVHPRRRGPLHPPAGPRG